jgi:hypothetical protein
LGLEPEEKYAPSPLFIIFFNAVIEQPVAFASSGVAPIFCTLYIFSAFVICGDFLDVNDLTGFLV